MLICLLAVAGIAAVSSDSASRAELRALVIGTIDFTALQDGTYTGEFRGKEGSLRDVTLSVNIQDGKLSDIRILQGALDKDGNPVAFSDGQTAMDLFSRVRESSSLQVDGISGATLTTNAHLKALENALQKAQKQP